MCVCVVILVVASAEDAHFTLLQAQYKALVKPHGYRGAGGTAQAVFGTGVRFDATDNHRHLWKTGTD